MWLLKKSKICSHFTYKMQFTVMSYLPKKIAHRTTKINFDRFRSIWVIRKLLLRLVWQMVRYLGELSHSEMKGYVYIYLMTNSKAVSIRITHPRRNVLCLTMHFSLGIDLLHTQTNKRGIDTERGSKFLV